MSIVSLLVTVLIICVVCWAATRLMTAFGVPEPVYTVVIVLLVLVVLLWFLGAVGISLPQIR